MLKPLIDAARAALPWRRLLSPLVRRWREWQHCDEVQRLDPDTLRDLGVDRSELASCDAEAAGTAAHTRRRIGVDPAATPVRMDAGLQQRRDRHTPAHTGTA